MPRLHVSALLLSLLACTPLAAEDDPATETPELAYADAPASADAPAATDDGSSCDPNRPNAAEPIDPQADVTQGRMAIKAGDGWLGLPLRETRYDTVVVGNVAETTVVQVFDNPLRDKLDAVYNFPLPTDAAVDDYWIRVDGREVRGVMKTRDDARRTFEAARDAGQSAGLLEQNRPNLFAQSVANIPPRGTIEVEMHLVQPLRREAGRYALVLPTSVGPRYIPGVRDAAGNTAQVPDAAAIAPSALPACSPVDIRVAIESALPVTALTSKYHRVTVDDAPGVTRVALARRPDRPNHDFDLSWQLAGAEPRAQLMAQRTGERDGYFTLTVEPPAAIARDRARPRELVFVLDTSGSMHGAPMQTAVAAVTRALEDLGPDDTFQILRFAGDTGQLADAPLPNTPENIARGLAYLTTMTSGGGTEMLAGVKAALARPKDRDRLRMVLFLTDGFIGNESEIFAEIQRHRGDARLFGLGVGSSVNHYLLDGMSRIGRGTVTYVGPGEPVDRVVERFYGYIDRPVLTDIEIDWGGLPVADVTPTALPDLFAGQPVVVYGRLAGAPTAGKAVLKAKIAGVPFEQAIKLDLAAGTQHTGLASMWARQRIDAMLGYPLRNTRELDTSARAAVTELAIAHRVMTEYTSFVAVETRKQTQPDGTVRDVEVELPPDAVGGGEVLGLGNIGLVGRGSGGGVGSGYGRGAGAGFGGRGTRVPQVRPAKPQVTGNVDLDLIRRIVRAHINEIRHCYNQALARDPQLRGKVLIEFAYGPNGKVISARVAEDDLADKAVGTCVEKRLRQWTFPKTADGPVIVKYPFLFEI